MIDTHAHLSDSSFDEDLHEVIERAGEAGLRGVVAVGESLADADRNLRIAERYPGFVLPAAGLFPTRIDLAAAEGMEGWIRRHREELVAIGEVGLDYWKVREEGEREIQRLILERFARLSLELDLPLNVHSRSCGRQTIDFLLERDVRRVQMHAFDGRAASALAGVEAGYMFSVPPSVVRSPQKQKLVKRLPLENLLLETDSPVLGPDRNRRNEPANVLVSLTAIAEIKSRRIEEVRESIDRNAERLYRFGSRLRSPRHSPSGHPNG